VHFNSPLATTTADNRFLSAPEVEFVSGGIFAFVEVVNNSTGGQIITFADSFNVHRVGTNFGINLSQTMNIKIFNTTGVFIEEYYTSEGLTRATSALGNLRESFICVETNQAIGKIELRSSTPGFNFGIDDIRFEDSSLNAPPAAVAAEDPAEMAKLATGSPVTISYDA